MSAPGLQDNLAWPSLTLSSLGLCDRRSQERWSMVIIKIKIQPSYKLWKIKKKLLSWAPIAVVTEAVLSFSHRSGLFPVWAELGVGTGHLLSLVPSRWREDYLTPAGLAVILQLAHAEIHLPAVDQGLLYVSISAPWLMFPIHRSSEVSHTLNWAW